MNNSLREVIEKLENLFDILNGKYFDNELQRPVITVSPDTTKGSYGWCTCWKAWKTGEVKSFLNMTEDEINAWKNEGFYEINLCAEYLNRSFEQIAGTMLHEMVHLYNVNQGVQDCSRSGTYHNKRFKESAEAHGLIVESTEKYGYAKTTLNEQSKAFVNNLNNKNFELRREKCSKQKKGGKKSSSRKYVCPVCGAIVRATKEVHIMCADCDELMIEEK